MRRYGELSFMQRKDVGYAALLGPALDFLLLLPHLLLCASPGCGEVCLGYEGAGDSLML